MGIDRLLHSIFLVCCFLSLGSCAGNGRNKFALEADFESEMWAAVEVDTTQAGLRIYYPHLGSVGLVTGEMPDTSSFNISFCCAAAFTGQCLNEFRHSNIAGDHVSDGMGKRYRGFRCTRNNGAFVAYNGRWKFLHKNYSAELDSAAAYFGSGFAQEMMIHGGVEVPHTRMASSENLFRALCEIDGKLCIADARDWGTFGEFINNLLAAGTTEALYLDMGAGWNHSWYRPEVNSELIGPAVIIHPKTHDYCTNWLTFWIVN
ncbi:MAG: hypothetical protein MJZ17_00330 [Bacteroidales bacterium]|nr:hypothetical protein [Bacteroidales bacterium]